MTKQISAPLVGAEKITEEIFRFTFFSPFVAQEAKPGNFIHLRTSQKNAPLLRRAFSLHKTDPQRGRFQILFKVVGLGTRVLSLKKKGEVVDLIGPLGNCFCLPTPAKKVILIAGGMGLAPLYFLLNELMRKRILREDRILFLHGTKNADEILYAKELGTLGIRHLVSTEDGSLGHRGLITDLLTKEVRKKDNVKLYACGPKDMMKLVSRLSRKANLDCQLSLETHMPCGVGACAGCVIETQKNSVTEYKKVCSDGPVFDAREVYLDES